MKIILTILIFIVTTTVFAQKPWSGEELIQYEDLAKENFLSSSDCFKKIIQEKYSFKQFERKLNKCKKPDVSDKKYRKIKRLNRFCF